MSSKQELYFKKLADTLNNINEQNNVKKNITNYFQAKQQTGLLYSKLDLAKKRAANIRQKTIDYLDTHLINFEAELVKRNVRVIWASDAYEANQEILEIIKEKSENLIVKAKSNTLNEINLTEFLKENKYNLLETDLGDYVNSKTNETPYQLILPLLNKNLNDINQIFNKQYSDLHQAAADITNEISLKAKQANIFISGATFLLADIGGIVLSENEGNILKNLANCKTHIVVCGIDKVLANITDIDLMLPLLSTYATGQFYTNYNTIITGNNNKNELIVILLDNGRTELLLNTNVRRAATCIKCGSCQLNDSLYMFNAKAQQGLYKGVIGTIINQHYDDEEENAYESFVYPFNATLINECPVTIDFNKLILYNRRDSVTKRLVPRSDSIAMFFYKNAVLKRSSMDKGGSKLKNFMLRQFFKKSWGQKRKFPSVAVQSFNEQWQQML